MGRLKHYQHCEVIIAPEGDEAACAVGGCEDEMVHQELKKCNSRNELGKQNNGKRFLTDKEIKALVEQFVKDDDIIAQTYEEIAKRRKDKCGSLGPHVSVKEWNGQKEIAQKKAIEKWNERL